MTVGIVGAGLSGLFVAAELDRLGIDTVVLEASHAIGGRTSTIADAGFLLEPAGGGFNLPNPAMTHFVDQFGLRVVPAAGAHRRYISDGDGLVSIPSSPQAGLVSPLLSLRGKARLMREPAVTSVSPDGETLHQFMVRRFGAEAGTLGAHLASAGVFAGDPDRLAVASAFPRLVEMERASGSIIRTMLKARAGRPPGVPVPSLHVPAAGMSTMCEQLAEHTRIRTGFEVKAVRSSDGGYRIEGPEVVDVAQVVLAVDPAIADRIAPGPLAGMLADRPTAPLVVVGLGARRTSLPLQEGFGVLVTPDSGLVSLGALFESAYAPDRAPVGRSLAKVLMGGALNPQCVEWSDSYLGRVAATELSGMLQADVRPDWVSVVRHRSGIPQYNGGHLSWLGRLDAVLERLPGLHLTGWGYRGVGVAHVAADALAIAGKIAAT